MLLINSWIITVLPTPAPPKAPILPPFVKGVIKSSTFIPVSNTDTSVAWSSKLGGFLCIGHLSSGASTSPNPSIGSPRVLNNLPKVASPTGTDIAFPVSITSFPLLKPSVGPNAIHLTQLFPICCSTSKTNFSSPILVSNALNTAGISSPVKSTSTTVPIICTIFPVAILCS